MTISLEQFLAALFTDFNLIEIRGIAPGWVNADQPIIRRYAKSIEQAVEMVNNLKAMATHGIYYGVLPRTARGSKREHVDGGDIAWVDVDAKQFDSDRHAEQALMNGIKELGEEPFCIVHSGHGFHAYWKLDGKKTNDVIESINKQIAAACGGDKAFDCTRVLRCPHTINNKHYDHPEMCSIYTFKPGMVARFTPENQPTYSHGREGSAPLQASLCSFSLDKLSPLWRRYVEGGIQADKRNLYAGDRSRLDMAVARELVKKGYEDDEIYSIFLDPSLGISEKALSKGSSAQKYILLTLVKARENISKMRCVF